MNAFSRAVDRLHGHADLGLDALYKAAVALGLGGLPGDYPAAGRAHRVRRLAAGAGDDAGSMSAFPKWRRLARGFVRRRRHHLRRAGAPRRDAERPGLDLRLPGG